jgi:hypothetical protein
VVWQRIALDVSDCENLSDINDRIIKEMFRVNSKTHCEEMCVRIELQGKTPLHGLLGTPGVLGDMREEINNAYAVFFCDSLENKTEYPLNKSTLISEGLFPAVFLNASKEQRSNSQEARSYLFEEFYQRSLSLPKISEKSLDSLLKEAENLVLDLLGTGPISG